MPYSSQSPIIVFIKLLAIVFIAESGVMLVLPVILPEGVDAGVEAFIDSCLLTFISGPLLWLVIVGPLRSAAQSEQMAVIAQMATGVAHELRNPLTSVKMLVQSNRETLSADADEGLKQDLTIIEEEIRRMERSIQTFLDFARPPAPDRKPVDLCELVRRTFSLIEPRARKQHVELTFQGPDEAVKVDADWEQLQQLLLNLAINALEAMPSQGSLDIELMTQRDGRVRLTVEDSGPGISSEIFPRLFQPFVTGKEAGVGLGLVISRRIANDHGGRLFAENRKHGGARFTLVLPPVEALNSRQSDTTQ